MEPYIIIDYMFVIVFAYKLTYYLIILHILLFFTIDPYIKLNKYVETVKNNTHK
jgi:hypothetical protein